MLAESFVEIRHSQNLKIKKPSFNYQYLMNAHYFFTRIRKC